MIARRKKAAAYHVRRSAVKKTQKEKRGIDKKRALTPAATIHLGFPL